MISLPVIRMMFFLCLLWLLVHSFLFFSGKFTSRRKINCIFLVLLKWLFSNISCLRVHISMIAHLLNFFIQMEMGKNVEIQGTGMGVMMGFFQFG